MGKKLRRSLTEYDLKDIDGWIDELGYGQDVIDEALSKTRGASKPTIRFVSAVLKGWYEQGLKTLEEVRDYEKDRAARIGRQEGPGPVSVITATISPSYREAGEEEKEYDTRLPRLDGADAGEEPDS